MHKFFSSRSAKVTSSTARPDQRDITEEHHVLLRRRAPPSSSPSPPRRSPHCGGGHCAAKDSTSRGRDRCGLSLSRRIRTGSDWGHSASTSLSTPTTATTSHYRGRCDAAQSTPDRVQYWRTSSTSTWGNHCGSAAAATTTLVKLTVGVDR